MPDVTSIHMNDSGVMFLVTVRDESGVVDLSAVQNVILSFQKPDRTIVSVTPEIVGDGRTGLLRYISGADDFDQAGRWKYQVVVQFATSDVKHSDVGAFNVDSNLPI